MTCDSCVYTINTKIGKKPGIYSINVDLDTAVSCVIYDPNVTAPDFIIGECNIFLSARVRL